MVSCLSELPLATGNFCGPVKPNYRYYFNNFTFPTSLQSLKFCMYLIAGDLYDSQNFFDRTCSMVPAAYNEQVQEVALSLC